MKITAEVQLRRLSYSSNQASSITFGVHDEEWEKFKGCEGKRFMAVFVEIGADEQPVYEYPKTEHKPVGPLCMLAVQWCKDERFWEWLNQLDGVNGDISSEEEAKDIILVYLDIDSRKQIDDNGPIAEEFHETFRKPFMAWLEKNVPKP